MAGGDQNRLLRATGAAAGGTAAGYGVQRGLEKLARSPVAQRAVAGIAPGMAVHDMHMSAARGGPGPAGQAQALAGDVYSSFADPAARMPEDFNALLQSVSPEREAGTGAVARREPTPREVGPDQLRQLYQQNQAASQPTQGEEDAGFERDLADLANLLDQLP